MRHIAADKVLYRRLEYAKPIAEMQKFVEYQPLNMFEMVSRLSVQLCRSKRKIAYMHQRTGKIHLSCIFMHQLKRRDAADTLLHEIAHGLTPTFSPSHGVHWQAVASLLGATPAKSPYSYV